MHEYKHSITHHTHRVKPHGRIAVVKSNIKTYTDLCVCVCVCVCCNSITVFIQNVIEHAQSEIGLLAVVFWLLLRVEVFELRVMRRLLATFYCSG
jgi:hypothetical protein